jgi:hypothetical protein
MVFGRNGQRRCKLADPEKKDFMTVINEYRVSLEKRAEQLKARKNRADVVFKRWEGKARILFDKQIEDVENDEKIDWNTKNQRKLAIQKAYTAKRSAKYAKLYKGVDDEEKTIREISNLLGAFLPTLKTTALVFGEFIPVLKTLIDFMRGDVVGALAMILGDGLLAGFNECVEKIPAVHKDKMSQLWAESLGRHRDALTKAGFTREEAIHLIGTLHGPLQQYGETLVKVNRK